MISISLGLPSAVVSQSDPVVWVSPSLVYLESGESATIEIRVKDVTALFGFALEVHFDPAKILAGSTALGDFLEPGLKPIDHVDNDNGIIQYEMTQIGTETTSKSGSGVLMVFEITLLEAVSETGLVIDSILLTDRNGIEIPCDLEHGKIMTPGFSPEYSVFLPLVLR